MPDKWKTKSDNSFLLCGNRLPQVSIIDPRSMSVLCFLLSKEGCFLLHVYNMIRGQSNRSGGTKIGFPVTVSKYNTKFVYLISLDRIATFGKFRTSRQVHEKKIMKCTKSHLACQTRSSFSLLIFNLLWIVS